MGLKGVNTEKKRTKKEREITEGTTVKIIYYKRCFFPPNLGLPFSINSLIFAYLRHTFYTHRHSQTHSPFTHSLSHTFRKRSEI